MIPERTRASDTPIYRQRVDAVARLASTRTRAIGIVEPVAATATEWTGHTTAFCVGPRARRGVDLSGPPFHYSDTWQLFINTVTQSGDLSDGISHPARSEQRYDGPAIESQRTDCRPEGRP